MFSVRVLVVFALFAIILATSTSAQTTTYTYTGNAFTIPTGTGLACPPICKLTGSFTVSQPLGPNYPADIEVTPLSFTFTDGLSTITNLNATPCLSYYCPGQGTAAFSFYVSTNDQGQIDSWNIEMSGPPAGDVTVIVYQGVSYEAQLVHFSTTSTGDAAAGLLVGDFSDYQLIGPPAFSPYLCDGCIYFNGAENYNLGTWTSGCQVSPPVPSIPQSGGTWGGLPYDHLGLDEKGKQITIAGRGCALTSLNMALNFAGESWNPGTLNSLLDATNGYTPPPAGTVNWIPATAASNRGRVGKPVIFDDLGGFSNSDLDLADAVETVESGICSATPLPVIVGVRSQKPGLHPLASHFVVITGEIINPDGSKAFTINDPAGYSTVLGTDTSTGTSAYTNSGGQPEFWTRGTVHDPTDLTGLSVTVDVVANIIVTDPNGFQSGFHPGNPNPVQDIPHSGAGLDEIDDDVTGDAGGPVQSVMINSPAAGVFKLSLTGAAAGQYSLVISAEASDGTVQTFSVPGLTAPGSTTTYHLEYDPTGATPPKLVTVRVPTTCAINSSSEQFSTGQAITFTALVTVPPGTGTPTGTITFVDSANSDFVLGTEPLVGGRASINAVLLGPPPRQWIAAEYSGDSNFQGCKSSYIPEDYSPSE